MISDDYCKLYLGIAREDITPLLGGRLFGYNDHTFSDNVHDRLQITALYFVNGDTKVMLLNATVGEVQTALAKRIREKVAGELQIPVEACILTTTHTHTAPVVMSMTGWGDIDTGYVETIFEPKILKAAKAAIQNTVYVKMGVAAGTSLTGINRRQLNPDNTISLRQNPWGPFNPEMTVMSFADADGNIIANLIHYGAHATAAGQCTWISRDWPGVMTDRLEDISGGITVFLQGAAGDVGPRLANGCTTSGKKGNPAEAMKCAMEHGSLAARDAVRIFKDIRKYEDVDLTLCSKEIHIPLQQRIPLEEAEKEYEIYKDSKRGTKAYIKQYYKDVIDAYANGLEEQEFESIHQSIIKVGDVAMVCFSYELFSEIAMRISQASKIPYTISVCYTNGADSYFVTEDAFCRGGYEVAAHECVGAQHRVPDGDWYLLTETLKNLEQLEQ